MLVLLLLLSPLGFGNLWRFGKVMRARYAVWRIERLGGKVVVDEPVESGWHWSVFGDTNAAMVSFSGIPVGDADLSCLRGFHKVYWVRLDHTSITDAGLDFVNECPELFGLSLRGAAVTDAGLKRLDRLNNLRILQLGGTNISDAGLKYLGRLPSLHELQISDTEVTDTGLKDLERLGLLTVLRLSRTKVSDAGVQYLEKIPNLQKIELDGTAVSKPERDRLKRLCAQPYFSRRLNQNLRGRRVSGRHGGRGRFGAYLTLLVIPCSRAARNGR